MSHESERVYSRSKRVLNSSRQLGKRDLEEIILNIIYRNGNMFGQVIFIGKNSEVLPPFASSFLIDDTAAILRRYSFHDGRDYFYEIIVRDFYSRIKNPTKKSGFPYRRVYSEIVEIKRDGETIYIHGNFPLRLITLTLIVLRSSLPYSSRHSSSIEDERKRTSNQWKKSLKRVNAVALFNPLKGLEESYKALVHYINNVNQQKEAQ